MALAACLHDNDSCNGVGDAPDEQLTSSLETAKPAVQPSPAGRGEVQ